MDESHEVQRKEEIRNRGYVEFVNKASCPFCNYRGYAGYRLVPGKWLKPLKGVAMASIALLVLSLAIFLWLKGDMNDIYKALFYFFWVTCIPALVVAFVVVKTVLRTKEVFCPECKNTCIH